MDASIFAAPDGPTPLIFGAKKKTELKSIGMIESQRQIGDRVSLERRFYLSSLSSDAKIFAKAVRRHWQIENGIHHVLDVTIREDEQKNLTFPVPILVIASSIETFIEEVLDDLGSSYIKKTERRNLFDPKLNKLINEVIMPLLINDEDKQDFENGWKQRSAVSGTLFRKKNW
ncbi:MAG: ISAs1 family transposase [Bacillus sp. (in: firmicutes)]